jgi:hypothetical protein
LLPARLSFRAVVRIFHGDAIMKSFKTLVLILTLIVLPWAQTSVPDNSKPDTQSTTKMECQKMMSAKDAKSCCAHHDMASKDGKGTSCCGGKDTKSCMKGDKKEMACAKEGCCKKDGDKSAMACCSGGECGMHHDAAPDTTK